MDASDHGPRPGRYLLELIHEANGFDDIQALTARSRQACDDLRGEHRQVRLVRSVFVPEDDTCFLLFESDSVSAIEEASRRAGMPVGPIWELHRAQTKEPIG